ncbi:hypothetical protein LCGC14_1963580 [marine sediment metagenome]|uniref:Uncharacterized protein n=1 Tax=marine sediment metagenome TaxID=412755 RepID=A0A0F9IAW3_9ZZZZ
MDKHQIADLKEQTSEEFWRDWERLYQMFEGRRKAEEKKFRPHSPKYDTAIRLLHNCLLDKGSNKRFWAEVESFLEAELDKPPEEAEEKLGWCSCGWVPEPGTVVPWSCPKCDADIQLPISNKPPEPECKHRKKHMKMFENFGERHFKGWSYIYYKDIGDKHCRDCGAKL